MFGFTTTSFLVSVYLFAAWATAVLAHPAQPAQLLPRVLQQAEILNAPIAKGVNPRCRAACNPLVTSLRVDVVLTTLCTNAVLTEVNNCYSCLAATGISGQALTTTANNFVTSCNAANAANIALGAVSIAANAAAEGLDGGDSNDGMRVVTSAGMIALSWVGLAITVFFGGF
ncbi:hypothetical protein B0H13DRAFT_1861988 [Mycena leptocephala]|nr:hypothetical protein B0H13DRAFT_1861988 [Mycena leptocephala]